MSKAFLLALAVTCASTAAIAAPAPTVETGYARGSLAVAAIERADWARAEQLLTDRHLNADDPARLINLGQVYWATGRQGEALSAWRRALVSNNHFIVETIGGRQVSTEQLAGEALASHQGAERSAAR
ncbi:MAG TPA: tetratricopeptide repeat protein [Allosphingosinicella sp.]